MEKKDNGGAKSKRSARTPVYKEAAKAPAYCKELKNTLDELCVSQRDLAKAIGVNEKTVQRYVTTTEPKEETKKKIRDFLYEKSYSSNLKHIPAKEFANMLQKLMNEFNVTQEELAKKVGKQQKDISRYCNGGYIDADTEFDILEVFLDKCSYYEGFEPKGVIPLHQGTFAILMKYMMGMTDFIEGDNFRIGFHYPQSSIELYAKRLHPSVQRIIVDHRLAFYENIECDGSGREHEFELIRYEIERLRNADEQERYSFLFELQESDSAFYPETNYQWFSFRQRAQFDDLVILTSERTLKELSDLNFDLYPDAKADQALYNDLSSMVNSVVYTNFYQEKEALELLKFKLSMTSFEWYLWKLMLI